MKNISLVILYIFISITSSSASDLIEARKSAKKALAPFVLKTGHAISSAEREDAERKLQGRMLRNTMNTIIQQAGEPTPFIESFNNRFNNYIATEVGELLPEEILNNVSATLINKADFLGQYSSSEEDGIVGAVIPIVKEQKPIDIAKAFLRLALLIKDEAIYHPTVKNKLMRVCFEKAREYQLNDEDSISDEDKCDYYTSIGQCTRWAGFRAGDIKSQRDLILEASNYLSEGKNWVHSLIEDPERGQTKSAYEEKIETEITSISERLKTLNIIENFARSVSKKSFNQN